VVLVCWAVTLLLVSAGVVGDLGKWRQGIAGRHRGGGSGNKGGSSKAAETSIGGKVGHRSCGGGGGRCTCNEGYVGELCDTAVCEQPCAHGKCLRPGYCTCEEGWKGRDCGAAECAMECGHGKGLISAFFNRLRLRLISAVYLSYYHWKQPR
jgi:hypothetical protein